MNHITTKTESGCNGYDPCGRVWGLEGWGTARQWWSQARATKHALPSLLSAASLKWQPSTFCLTF